MSDNFKKALILVDNKLKYLRGLTPRKDFDHESPAEVEINKFWFQNETVNRLMVVLRATGCSHYSLNQGCSMCSHYNGTTKTAVTSVEYINQWDSVINGKSITDRADFDINKYPVLCLYNLGSFLNPKEVPVEAMKHIFKSINSLHGVKKTIIESRAEYITRETLETIRQVNNGLIEVGIGLESVTYNIRELCHHKQMPLLSTFSDAVKLLHEYNFKVLAYVNLKPPFLTEKEAVDDAIKTSIFAFKNCVDAVSIEPTSLQENSLCDYLYQLGFYRVPWLWSVIDVVRGVSSEIGKNLDLRLGGYFDEEILSGSQGASPGVARNELFPYATSGNCDECTLRIINAIKDYNQLNDPKRLYEEPKCDSCYPLWQSSMGIKDSRTISRRIIDLLGKDL